MHLPAVTSRCRPSDSGKSTHYRRDSGLDSGEVRGSDFEGAGYSGDHGDLLYGIIPPWMEKLKQAQSFVSCGETVA